MELILWLLKDGMKSLFLLKQMKLFMKMTFLSLLEQMLILIDLRKRKCYRLKLEDNEKSTFLGCFFYVVIVYTSIMIGKIIGRRFVFSYKKWCKSICNFIFNFRPLCRFAFHHFIKCFGIKLCASLIKSPDSLM